MGSTSGQTVTLTRKFLHQSPKFPRLLEAVAKARGISTGLLEKDYWAIHCLWAFEAHGLAYWVRGSYGCQKGFGLGSRFPQVIDLRLDRGSVYHLPVVSSWEGEAESDVASRVDFFETLIGTLRIPHVQMQRVPARKDSLSKELRLQVRYKGYFQDQLPQGHPEYLVFRSRVLPVTPNRTGPTESVIHEVMRSRSFSEAYLDNRPRVQGSVHPWVHLFESIERLRRAKDMDLGPMALCRSLEDAGMILEDANRIPSLEQSPRDLAEELLFRGQIRALPEAEDPGLRNCLGPRLKSLAGAFEAMREWHLGPRLSLEECSRKIVEFLRTY